MNWKTTLLITLVACTSTGCGKEGSDSGRTGANGPYAETTDDIRVDTSLGAFVIRLKAQAAPNTVANFLAYVNEGFYDGSDGLPATTFHRVIADFMIQGGGMRTDGKKKLVSRDALEHEGPNGLANLRGTVAMARTDDPDSATSQFFVNHVDNAALDYESADNPGYVVFGEVVSGMDTVDAIAIVDTDSQDVPVTPVVIEAVGVAAN